MNDPDAAADVGIWALFGVLGVGIALGLGGSVAIWVLTGHWPHAGVWTGLMVLLHPGSPWVAWQQPTGPLWAYWLISGVVGLLVVSVLVWVGVRVFGLGSKQLVDPGRHPDRVPGLAGAAEVRRVAGDRQLLKAAKTLRPSLGRSARLTDVGWTVGVACGFRWFSIRLRRLVAHGVAVWVGVRDSIVVLGAPGSGKGLHLVMRAILDAPGAVITTSTRPDNALVTMTARADGGRPVMVFDPQGLAAGVPGVMAWSPIRGCEHPRTAMVRAVALTAGSADGTEDSSYWATQAAGVVQGLLHAAALAKVSTPELWSWTLSPGNARTAVDILSSTAGAAPGWAGALRGVVEGDPRLRDNIWSVVTGAFAAMADPDVLAACTPPAGAAFDPVSFLRDKGTLYLLGTASGASAAANLIAALVEDIVETGRVLAAASTGARLDPPCALVLDEAANYPLPSLPSLMSEGGGTGFTMWVFLQSLAQARKKWGKDAAEIVWDAATVKVILGGGGNADDLKDLSTLMGQYRETRVTTSGGRSGRGWSESVQDSPILDPGQIRRIKFGWGLVLLRSGAPIMARLQRWIDRDDASRLTTDRRRLEELLQRAAAQKPAGRA